MRRALVAASVLLAAGCGQDQSRKPAASPPASRACTPAGEEFRTCERLGRSFHPTVQRRAGDHWVVVAGPLRGHDPTAQWLGPARLSPDRQTILAEWIFPCDSGVAVFVPAWGGASRIVTGHRDWRTAPISRALGWTSDGKARVKVSGELGVQLIDPHAVEHLRARATRC